MVSNISNNSNLASDIMKKIEEYFPLKKPRCEESMYLRRKAGMMLDFNLWYGEYQVLFLLGDGRGTNFSGSPVDDFLVEGDLSFDALKELICLLKEQYHLYRFQISNGSILLDFAMTANHEELYGYSSYFIGIKINAPYYQEKGFYDNQLLEPYRDFLLENFKEDICQTPEYSSWQQEQFREIRNAVIEHMTKEQLALLFRQLNEKEHRDLLKQLPFERLIQIYPEWKKEYEKPLSRYLSIPQNNSLKEKNEKS